MSVLDDEQIESLMMETGEYVTFLAQHTDFSAGTDAKAIVLPAKLSYLQVCSSACRVQFCVQSSAFTLFLLSSMETGASAPSRTQSVSAVVN